MREAVWRLECHTYAFIISAVIDCFPPTSLNSRQLSGLEPTAGNSGNAVYSFIVCELLQYSVRVIVLKVVPICVMYKCIVEYWRWACMWRSEHNVAEFFWGVVSQITASRQSTVTQPGLVPVLWPALASLLWISCAVSHTKVEHISYAKNSTRPLCDYKPLPFPLHMY